MPEAQAPLGIVGGMSWVSSAQYYRLINEGVARARGRQRSAPLLLASVDFQPVVDAQARGDWAGAGAIVAGAAASLERAGAGAFMIASNTMHRVLEQARAAVAIPAIDIFDATAAAVRAARVARVALLGTRYTMSDPFYAGEYARRGVEVVTPAAADAARVNEIIFKELIHGVVRPESAAFYREAIARLAQAGCEGVILGCTEIELLVRPGEDVGVPVFDTTALHAEAGVRWLLGGAAAV